MHYLTPVLLTLSSGLTLTDRNHQPEVSPLAKSRLFYAVQESFKQIAMISSLFAMSPSSVQYGMNLSAAQVTSSAASISPTFTVNEACLDRCGLAGAPAAG